MPISCPICGSDQVEAIAGEIVVRPTVEGEHPIGGLLAYQCSNKHKFFVRSADLNAEDKG